MLGYTDHKKEENENIGSRLHLSDNAIMLFEEFRFSGEAFSAVIELLEPPHVFACIFDEVKRCKASTVAMCEQDPEPTPFWDDIINEQENVMGLLDQANHELLDWDDYRCGILIEEDATGKVTDIVN